MNSRFTFWLIVLLGYIFLATWWWDCSYCADPGVDEEVPGRMEPDMPLGFKWNEAVPYAHPEKFAPFVQDSVLGLLDSGKVMRIEGPYYAGEISRDSTQSLGLRRAAHIKALLADFTDTSNIELSSRRIGETPDPIPEGLFAGYRFSSRVKDKPVKLEASKELVTIYFPFGSEGRLKEEDVSNALDEVVKTYQRSRQSLSVTGHTDNIDTDVYNLNLGRKRAEAVRQMLIARGIPGEMIRVDSRGESEPKASNETEAGRQQNRRVEILFLPR